MVGIKDSNYVTENFFHEIEVNSSHLTSRQRKKLEISQEDLVDGFVYKIDIFEDETKETKYVKLDCTLSLMPGLEQMLSSFPKENSSWLQSSNETMVFKRYMSSGGKKIQISCSLIRDYTKNAKDSTWKINALNFTPSTERYSQ